jgi:hypothetical protein
MQQKKCQYIRQVGIIYVAHIPSSLVVKHDNRLEKQYASDLHNHFRQVFLR